MLKPDAGLALAEVGHLHPEDVRAEGALGRGRALRRAGLGRALRSLGKRLGHREEVHVSLELLVRLLQLADLFHDRSGCGACGGGGRRCVVSDGVDLKTGIVQRGCARSKMRDVRADTRAIRTRCAAITRACPGLAYNSRNKSFKGENRATARGSRRRAPSSRSVKRLTFRVELVHRAHHHSAARILARCDHARRARAANRVAPASHAPSPLRSPCGGDISRDGAARARDGGAHLSRPAAGGLGYEVTREF